MAAVQFKDYYKTLGIDRNATDKEIRAAYLKLARQYHPDKNQGDLKAEERFKEINEANEVLSDADKRKMYDRFGEDWQRYRDAGYTGDEPAGRTTTGGAQPDFGQWFTGQTGGPRFDFEETAGADGFSDFFKTVFGRSGYASGRQARRRGDDLETNVTLSFDEAYRGTTRGVNITHHETCPTCGGSGFAREAPCPTCDTAGTVPKRSTIEVRIPAGIATGQSVRVAGKGEAGINGGPNGDVYLRVTVKDDPRFERQGDDLKTEFSVPLYTAILGGEVVVPTPGGRVALTVPPETSSGKTFRLRGKGMPKRGKSGEFGDLLAKATVALPSKLSEQERELFEKLRGLRPGA
ncbi:MAG: J domain-containing protein [Thermomicrobiales bacterium]|nr:J domain-containing protein [Thermomicrobiales bacterium]